MSWHLNISKHRAGSHKFIKVLGHGWPPIPVLKQLEGPSGCQWVVGPGDSFGTEVRWYIGMIRRTISRYILWMRIFKFPIELSYDSIYTTCKRQKGFTYNVYFLFWIALSVSSFPLTFCSERAEFQRVISRRLFTSFLSSAWSKTLLINKTGY